VESQDDFASMREVITRRFSRMGAEPGSDDWNESFVATPNLVVIDGGKGQLSAALEAMAGLDLPRVAVIALAKRIEEVFVPGRPGPILLPPHTPGLQLLQRIRDEAHRFAITFQRKRRAVRTITSELLRIPGIGDNKRRLLLTTFGSLQAVRDASPEQIAAIPGFSLKSANKILASLRATDALAPAPAAVSAVPPSPDIPSLDDPSPPADDAEQDATPTTPDSIS
jgi:excinuclease ABC subunit C